LKQNRELTGMLEDEFGEWLEARGMKMHVGYNLVSML